MKIGIVCFPTYGGSGAVAGELARGLASRGHEIHMISYALPFRLKSFTRKIVFHEVETLNYPPFPSPPYVLSLASRIIEICRDYSLDILHLHYAIPHTTSAFLAKCVLGSAAPALITTLHGTDITLVGSHPSYYPITRFSIEQSDGITSVSQYLRKTTQEVFHMEKEIEVIYNFIDTDKFAPRTREDVKHELCVSSERILMHISNFRPVKRVFDVIRIFERVRKEADVKLVLVGDGDERPAALSLASELGLKEKVIFLGKQDNVEELIPCADVLLLPSADESFGLVALEAISCGVPVVGTRVGGLPEVIPDGCCGFLSTLGDVEGMAASTLRLLSDSQLMTEFRKAGRERAEEFFDERIIIPRYEKFYEKVLKIQKTG
jgi:L-malate glycosyltransferase